MKSVFGICFNWKVLLGIAIVLAGILALAPRLIFAAFPLLIFAVCPLSMLLMMAAGHGHGSAEDHSMHGHPGPASKELIQQRLASLHEEERTLHAQLQQADADDDAEAVRPDQDSRRRPVVSQPEG